MRLGRYLATFVKKFNRDDVTYYQLRDKRKREGWETRKRGITYSKAELRWLKRNSIMRLSEYHAAFVEKFKRPDVTAPQLQDKRKRQGWKTIRRGGDTRRVPFGSQAVRHGVVFRKVRDDGPQWQRWEPAHMIDWQAKNGPLPDGYVLKCRDGNKLNITPSNWVAVPRTMLPDLIGLTGLVPYGAAPDELKPTILLTATLKHQVRELRR
jgi:hypothetical protein